MSGHTLQRRRVALMGCLIGALVTSVVLIRSLSNESRGPAEPLDQLPRAEIFASVIPDLCKTQEAVSDGETTKAYDHFYRRAHYGIHLISFELDRSGDEGRQRNGELLKAKSAVEAGLLTNPSTLSQDVASLLSQTAAALALLAPEAPTRC
jgi:hypothetical protein